MPKTASIRRKRRTAGVGDIPAALKHFDSLPDSARVRIPVVAAIMGRSSASIWRDVKAGRLPEPLRFGRTTAWLVGDLRAVINGEFGQGGAAV